MDKLKMDGVNFDFEFKFDLEGQGQSLPKTIGILTKVFYIHGPNLVILAKWVMSYRADKLKIDAQTEGRTHRQTQATTIPEGQNWTRVKMCWWGNDLAPNRKRICNKEIQQIISSTPGRCDSNLKSTRGSAHGTATVLLLGFAIDW